MLTQKKQTAKAAAQGVATLSKERIAYLEECENIVASLLDDSLPFNQKDIRNFLIYVMHDAWIHKDGNAVFNDRCLSTCYYLNELCVLLDDLVETHGAPGEQECFDINGA